MGCVDQAPAQLHEIVAACVERTQPFELARAQRRAQLDLAPHDVEGVRRDACQELGTAVRLLHDVAAQEVTDAVEQLIGPGHVGLAIARVALDQRHGSRDQQIHAVDLALGRAAADTRPFHGPVGTAPVDLDHLEAPDRPPEGAEDLPELDVLRIDGLACDRLVAAE